MVRASKKYVVGSNLVLTYFDRILYILKKLNKLARVQFNNLDARRKLKKSQAVKKVTDFTQFKKTV